MYKSSRELFMVHKTPEIKQETRQIFIFIIQSHEVNGFSVHEFSIC